MTHRLRLIAIASLALLLASCVHNLALTVTVIDGKVAFAIDRSGNFCMLFVTVFDFQGATAWKFHTEPEASSATCEDRFPVSYGRAPSDAVVQAPAKPLQMGKVYLVNASVPGAHGEAAFVLYRGGDTIEVHQLTSDSPIVDAIRRKTGQYMMAPGH